MKREKKKEKKFGGFTLIEMLIYVASLVLVIGTVAAMLVWLVRASNEVHVKNELAANIEHALILMSNEIREAQSVYAPTSVFESSPGQLSLKTRNSVPADESSTYIDFFLCGTRLCVKRESQLPLAITTEKIEIQNLEFAPVQTGSARSIQITLGAAYRAAVQEMQTTVSLRMHE